MTLEAVKNAAASNEWGAIMPELSLALLALLLLVFEIVLPKKERAYIPGIAILGQIAILIEQLVFFNTGSVGTETFNGLLHHSYVGQAFRVFFLLAGILVSILGQVSLAKQKMPKIEFFHTVLVVTAAMQQQTSRCYLGIVNSTTRCTKAPFACMFVTPTRCRLIWGSHTGHAYMWHVCVM